MPRIYRGFFMKRNVKLFDKILIFGIINQNGATENP